MTSNTLSRSDFRLDEMIVKMDTVTEYKTTSMSESEYEEKKCLWWERAPTEKHVGASSSRLNIDEVVEYPSCPLP